MTPYHHLLQVGFLRKKTWKLCYCVGVLLGNGFRINTDGKEEKIAELSRGRSETENLSPWGLIWGVLRLGQPVWVVLSWGQGTRLYCPCQSATECGPPWEGGMTFDEMASFSWGSPWRGGQSGRAEGFLLAAVGEVKSFIFEGGFGRHIMASTHHWTGWNHNNIGHSPKPDPTCFSQFILYYEPTCILDASQLPYSCFFFFK